LILWGDKDSWFPVSHGEKLHQNLPNSRLQILRNCYHDAATDSAEVINTAILEFLNTTN
jgi:pimeloyl-ACP methyl ester carboxylesterase